MNEKTITVCVDWPAELTKRRLLDVSHGLKADGHVYYAQIVDALAAIAPQAERTDMNADDEKKLDAWLESEGFYEICQNYRHARDASKPPDERDNATQAFERLKREIRERADYSAGRRAGLTEAAGVCEERKWAGIVTSFQEDENDLIDELAAAIRARREL